MKRYLLSSVSHLRPLGAVKLGDEREPFSIDVKFTKTGQFFRFASWQLRPTEMGIPRSSARQLKEDWLRWGVQSPYGYEVLRKAYG